MYDVWNCIVYIVENIGNSFHSSKCKVRRFRLSISHFASGSWLAEIEKSFCDLFKHGFTIKELSASLRIAYSVGYCSANLSRMYFAGYKI